MTQDIEQAAALYISISTQKIPRVTVVKLKTIPLPFFSFSNTLSFTRVSAICNHTLNNLLHRNEDLS